MLPTNKFKGFALMLLSCLLLGQLQANNERNDPNFDLEVIKKRIETLDSSVVKPQFTREVEGYVRGYLVRNRGNSERILGRQVLYFPIFEKKLNQNGLPESMKYLSIVESALVPDAVSRAKAVGLWQFMDETGRSFGLQINKEVDERMDPIKSTDAAIKMLQALYNRYQSWELALAAYNSGAGRVSRAIKRARSTNFWRIRRYLPRETRNYVPAFIAATYLMNYYEQHNLTPQYPELDLQITETIKVFDRYTFNQIAQNTDISIEVIKFLNPSYRKDFIPANINGNYLTLPSRVMDKMRTHLALRRPDFSQYANEGAPILVYRAPRSDSRKFYQEVYFKVPESTDIYALAKQLKCSTQQLRAWNNLKGRSVYEHQVLKLFIPKDIKDVRQYLGMEVIGTFNFIHTPKPFQPIKGPSHFDQLAIQTERLGQYSFLYYEVERRARLHKIAQRLNGVTLDDLMELNGYISNQMIKPGTRLKVKEIR